MNNSVDFSNFFNNINNSDGLFSDYDLLKKFNSRCILQRTNSYKKTSPNTKISLPLLPSISDEKKLKTKSIPQQDYKALPQAKSMKLFQRDAQRSTASFSRDLPMLPKITNNRFIGIENYNIL